MFKLFILIICSLLFSETVYSYFDEDISRLEYQNFSRVFQDESIGERLNRLETSIFGMSQSGDIDERLDRLVILSNNQKKPSMTVPYDNKPKNKIKRIFNSALDIFDSGTVTGFTPPLYDSSYGFSDNMYRQEFNNFLSNPKSYCPYHHRYQPNLYNPQVNPNSIYLPSVSLPAYSGYYPISRRYYQRTYTPPDIITRTGVHIIND